jgi:DNA-binding NtrC family response regulator
MGDSIRILVVEDNRTLREEVRELLEDAGYRVRGARNVKKAAHRLSHHKFDLILTDYDLGDATGFDVLEVATTHHPDAKLVVMSADANPELSDQALKSGAARFLEKPFRAARLLELVNEVLTDLERDEALTGNSEQLPDAED